MLEIHNIVLEIYNIMLELVNKTHKIMRKTVFIAVLSVSVLVSMIFWIARSSVTLNLKESSLLIIQLVVVVFAVFFALEG